MQITLNQDEIHEAVETYVRSQISIAPNQTVAIDFTAGRGEKGLSATLDIRTSSPATGGFTKRSVEAVKPPVRAITASPEERQDPDQEEATDPDAEDQPSEEVTEGPDTGEADAAEAEPEAPAKPKASPFKKAASEMTASTMAEDDTSSSAPKSIFSKKAS